MSVRELRHDRPSGRFSKSRGLSVSAFFLSSPPPPRSFTCAIRRSVFDSRSSFFAPKPHRNACYAGYVLTGFRDPATSVDRKWLLFNQFKSLDATRFVFLSAFILEETICEKFWQNYCPRLKKLYFRSTCVFQKRLFLLGNIISRISFLPATA